MATVIVLQNEINTLEKCIQTRQYTDGGQASQEQVDIWENTLASKKTELALALENQTPEERLEKHVAENGYIFAKLKSGEYTMAELAHTPEDFILQATAVQQWGLEQQDAFDRALSELQNSLDKSQNDLKIQMDANTEVSGQLYQAMLDRADAEQKRDNISRLYSELQEQIKQQEAGTLPSIAPLTAEEQDAQWKAQNTKQNNRIKVTSIRNADSTGIDTRKSIVTLALTGEEEETDTLYIKRYILISEDEAKQLRDDYEAKKAEIEAQNESIPFVAEPTVNPVNPVTEQETASQEETFQSDQIPEANGSPVALGSSESDREGTEKKNYVTMQWTPSEPTTIEERVEQIEREQSMMHDWVKDLSVKIQEITSKQAVA